jgi:hypothetical protein
LRFFLVGSIAIIILIDPNFVFADASADYSKFKHDNYYLLDDQQFSKIKCQVRVPNLNNALTNFRQQLQSLPGKVVIKENVEDFSIVYDRSQGLSFTKTNFDIKALDPGSIANPSLFNKGLQFAKNGLNEIVSGIVQIVDGLFEEYTLSKKRIIQNFLKNDSGVEVTSELDGITYKDKYLDSTCKSEYSGSGGMVGVGQEQFEKIGNRLVLSKSSDQTQQPGANVDISMKISYGKVGDIFFPNSIIANSIVQVNGVKQAVETDVYFDKCTVE